MDFKISSFIQRKYEHSIMLIKNIIDTVVGRSILIYNIYFSVHNPNTIHFQCDHSLLAIISVGR
jgi:hypothetical protein